MPKSQRQIAIVTGTRAEFGTFESVIQAIQQRDRLQVRLIVTGMHLLKKFGHTIDEIRGKGYRIDATVKMQTGRDEAAAQAGAVGRGIDGIARAIDRLDCDTVLVLGDRIEAFAGAAAGALARRMVAHIHGGDRAPGDIDDSLRNAITRLAHIHFAASQHAANRLARMGEPKDRIHLVGGPGLDAIRRFRQAERRAGQSGKQLDGLIGPMAGEPYAVVVYHASGRPAALEAKVMRAVIRAVEKSGLAAVAIWPNSDPGHDGVIAELKKIDRQPNWRVFRSLVREDYLRLVHHAAILVGNSSSGIIESASLGVNAVNIGPRQQGRLRCGRNVIEAAESPASITRAVNKALNQPPPDPTLSVYGDGCAGERIARILQRTPPSPALFRKMLSY